MVRYTTALGVLVCALVAGALVAGASSAGASSAGASSTGALAAHAGGAAPPPGATAVCNDGTYSYSRHHSGTCSQHGGVAHWLGTAASPTRVALGSTVLLGPRTRSAGCVRSPRPDRRCSPGAHYSGLTTSVICSPTFRTSAIRNVPDSEKHAVEREYGMTPRPYGRTIEIDHIVSLELGGSNDIANLFPEPGAGPANYHLKDRLENRLHALVCAGALSLRAAQLGIARHWESLYTRVFGVVLAG